MLLSFDEDQKRNALPQRIYRVWKKARQEISELENGKQATCAVKAVTSDALAMEATNILVLLSTPFTRSFISKISLNPCTQDLHVLDVK